MDPEPATDTDPAMDMDTNPNTDADMDPDPDMDIDPENGDETKGREDGRECRERVNKEEKDIINKR